jgi:hypothetical protein
MTGIISLTSAGIMSGPFNIYSNIDGFLSAFLTNLTKEQLLDGYPTDLIPDGTSIIRISSSGVCYNYIDLAIPPATTTTSTSTTSTSSTTTTSTSSTTTTSTTTTSPVEFFSFMRDGTQTPGFHIPSVDYIDTGGNPATFYPDPDNDICGGFFALSIVTINYSIVC